MNRLPNELLSQIFEGDWKRRDLAKAALVCRLWSQIVPQNLYRVGWITSGDNGILGSYFARGKEIDHGTRMKESFLKHSKHVRLLRINLCDIRPDSPTFGAVEEKNVLDYLRNFTNVTYLMVYHSDSWRFNLLYAILALALGEMRNLDCLSIWGPHKYSPRYSSSDVVVGDPEVDITKYRNMLSVTGVAAKLQSFMIKANFSTARSLLDLMEFVKPAMGSVKEFSWGSSWASSFFNENLVWPDGKKVERMWDFPTLTTLKIEHYCFPPSIVFQYFTSATIDHVKNLTIMSVVHDSDDDEAEEVEEELDAVPLLIRDFTNMENLTISFLPHYGDTNPYAERGVEVRMEWDEELWMDHAIRVAAKYPKLKRVSLYPHGYPDHSMHHIIHRDEVDLAAWEARKEAARLARENDPYDGGDEEDSDEDDSADEEEEPPNGIWLELYRGRWGNERESL